MSSQDRYFPGTSPPQSLTENEVNLLWRVMVARSVNVSSLKQISPVALAYLGDAVYELYIRTRYLLPPKRISDYHQQVVTQVRAETQAFHLQTLEPYLTDTEKEIVRRGRNAAKGCPRRLSPELYQQATSLEALLGYLYVQNPQRLEDLLAKLALS